MWAEWCDREVLRCESAQDSFDRHPHFWSRDMKAYSEGVRGRRDKEALPYDVKACGGSWVELQEFVCSYGALLQAWPAMWHTARLNPMKGTH